MKKHQIGLFQHVEVTQIDSINGKYLFYFENATDEKSILVVSSAESELQNIIESYNQRIKIKLKVCKMPISNMGIRNRVNPTFMFVDGQIVVLEAKRFNEKLYRLCDLNELNDLK